MFLSAGPEPDKQGLGAVYPLVTHASGGREVKIKLFTERLLVSRAISKADQLTLRFLASLLLVEFFVRWNQSRELSVIQSTLIERLGGPWPFNANWSLLTVELARHELSAGLDKTGIFGGAKTVTPWFSLECPNLSQPSTLWQWNPEIPKQAKRGKPIGLPAATPIAGDPGQKSPQP